MGRSLFALIVTTVCSLVSSAFATTKYPSNAATKAHVKAEVRPTSRAKNPVSVGPPNRGHLEHGLRLENTPHTRVLAANAAHDVRYGTKELVGVLQRASRDTARHFPGSVLGFGHLSLKHGGFISGHNSHTSGRDADIAFYFVDQKKKPVFRERLMTVRTDGRVAIEPSIRFDEARNWTFVRALVSDPLSHVTHIFIANHLKSRLLHYAERLGESPLVRLRASEVMMQPANALPHDNHFHVRVACPVDSVACMEWPIVRGQSVRAVTHRKANRRMQRRNKAKIASLRTGIIRANTTKVMRTLAIGH